MMVMRMSCSLVGQPGRTTCAWCRARCCSTSRCALRSSSRRRGGACLTGVRWQDGPMDDNRVLLEEERRATLGRLAALTGDFTALVEASEGRSADDEHYAE